MNIAMSFGRVKGLSRLTVCRSDKAISGYVINIQIHAPKRVHIWIDFIYINGQLVQACFCVGTIGTGVACMNIWMNECVTM